ncbi:MAG: hypothetical protein ACYTAN_13960 [Planctomycetota bacterium]|jgi:hypothetical protein
MFTAGTLKDAGSIKAFAIAFAVQVRAAVSQVIAKAVASSEGWGPFSRSATYEVSPLPNPEESLGGAYRKVDVARSWVALYS